MGNQPSLRRHQGMLWGMGLGGFLVNADNRAIAPMLPAIAGTLHVSTSAAALLVSAYSIPYGLFQLVYGPIADRIGKIRTILIALGLFSLGTVVCGLVHTFAWLVVLRFITGMFAAGIIPTTLAQIGDLFELADRPRAIAFFMSLTTSGQALGIVIGGLLAQYLSYRYLFILIGFAAIPTLIGLWKRQKTDSTRESASQNTFESERGPFWARYRTLFAKRTSWLIYTLILLEGFAFYAGFTFLGVFGVSVIHLSYLIIGLLTATYSAGAFVGSRTLGFVLGKVTTRFMPILGATLMTIAFALDWAWHSSIVLMLSFIVLGLGFSYCHSTLQTYATDLLPRARATAMSVFAFSLFTGSGLGPMAAGAVFSAFGWDALLGSVTAAMAIFAGFTTLLIRQPRQMSQTQSSSLQS
jgi:predicted MFS family arabinose efflux permease